MKITTWKLAKLKIIFIIIVTLIAVSLIRDIYEKIEEATSEQLSSDDDSDLSETLRILK